MSAATLTAGQVMDGAASLMNDSAKVTYTYAAQIPYLRIALQKLRVLYELNSVAVTQKTSSVIEMDAGDTEITYPPDPIVPGDPVLPEDFVEPLQLWERPRGTDPWIPMTRKDFIPHYLEGQPFQSNFIWFQWDDQKITVLEANQDNDIKIDYIKELFQEIEDEDSEINVVNAINYLQFKTAALLARFIERNKTSADELDTEALLEQNIALGISSKSKQTIFTRRRPFRQSWKHRGGTIIT